MGKVLTIDDDKALRRTISRVLQSEGHDTLEAENGRIGVEIVFRAHPDLVITDIMMPEMDGIEVIREIRSALPRLPIIALSGSDTAWASAQLFGSTGWGSSPYSPLAQARQAGVDVTIGKPFENAVLLAAVNKLLASAQPPGDPSAPSRTAKREVYHIRQDRSGRWSIQRDGVELPIARTETKDDAIALAQTIASGAARARVIVYHPDGTIEIDLAFGLEASEELD